MGKVRALPFWLQGTWRLTNPSHILTLISHLPLELLRKAGSVMALIGYARVSTEDQNTDERCDALLAAGVKGDKQHLFVDHGISGSKASRPGLDSCLASLREGDTLVIAKLDRPPSSIGSAAHWAT